MKKPVSDIGVYGLGTMGAALAQNIEAHGYHVSVHNRSFGKTKDFLNTHSEKEFVGYRRLKEFVMSIKKPRRIMIMVKAGPAVDDVIAHMIPYLSRGDCIIDGGNSFYRDTQKRTVRLKKRGIYFVGTGISGGEEGAMKGPSIMPGGSTKGWHLVRPIFESIAAKDFDGNPCVTHVGKDGAGHYVKMVHNGIEYGIMQLIAETYALFHDVYGLSAEEIAKIFARYNKGKLKSFLVEITVPVLSKGCDPKKGSCLIYNVLDKASNKGTGKWTSIDALDRGVAVPAIAQAVFARYISTEKKERVRLEKKYTHAHKKPKISRKAYEKIVEDALYAAMFSTFAQGYDLIQKAADDEGWDIDLGEVSRIWEGGCIIRAKLLNVLHIAYKAHRNKNVHVFAVPTVQKIMKQYTPSLRKLVSVSVDSGISLAGYSSALYYFESMTEGRLPANVIQGLRDYFGSHTYERIDKPGMFHTDWE